MRLSCRGARQALNSDFRSVAIVGSALFNMNSMRRVSTATQGVDEYLFPGYLLDFVIQK